MLYFDGDKKRIYEVPENSSFTLTDGYRVYTPNNLDTAPKQTFVTATELWSRWIDYHHQNQWALLAWEKTGGGYRFTDANGIDVYQTFDIRLINGWELVIANYPHTWNIQGNVFPNEQGVIFDTNRLTEFGAFPFILGADSLQTAVVNSSGNNTETNQDLTEITLMLKRILKAVMKTFLMFKK